MFILRPVTAYKLTRIHRAIKGKKNSLLFEDFILSDLKNMKTATKVVSNTRLILEMDREVFLRSNLQKFKLIRNIMKSPGRLRWLCLNLGSGVFEDAYELSRFKLIVKLVKNHSTFNSLILNKLSVSRDSFPYTTVESFYYFEKNSRYAFASKTRYLLEERFFSRTGFLSFLVNRNKKPFLFYLILFFPVQFNDYFLSIPASKKNIYQDFFHQYRDLQKYMNSFSSLSLFEHPNSDLSFDQRLELFGLNSFDTLVDVEIWYQRFLIQKDSLIQIDSTCSPRQKFVAGHWQFVNQDKRALNSVVLRKPTTDSFINLSEAIFLSGRCDENWYHLILDTLPRYMFMQNIHQSVPVLIRGDIPESSLNLIRRILNREVLLLNNTNVVTINKLHFVAARSTVFDSKPISNVNQVYYSPLTIQLTRDFVLSKLDAGGEFLYPPKIFVNRNSAYRNLLNSDSFFSIVQKLGFSRIEMNPFFYSQQFHFFGNAQVVISPGGAVLANIIFMPRGSQVLLIRSYRDSDLKLWEMLAAASGVDFKEIKGIPTYFGFSSLKRKHANFFVPLIRFRIRKLLTSKKN